MVLFCRDTRIEVLSNSFCPNALCFDAQRGITGVGEELPQGLFKL